MTNENLANPGPGAWLRLLGRVDFGLFPLLFWLLPFSALEGAPGHDLVGGLFVELGPAQLFLTVVPLVLSTWATMTVLGLIVEGPKVDPPVLLPAWSRVLDLPPRRPTFLVFAALALPGIVVMVARSRSIGPGALAAAGGVVAAYLTAMVLAAPLATAEEGYVILPGPLSTSWTRWLARRPRVVQAVRWLRGVASRVMRHPPFDGACDPEARQIDIDHFAAAGLCVATLGAFLVEAWFFRPWIRTAPTLPAAALVFTLGVALIWIFGALSFHLRRYHLSPMIVIVLGATIGYVLTGYDHHFHVTSRPASEVAPPSPADVARTVGSGNLVVVTATGGGILAAGWTTWALHELVGARPQLLQEIRLLSGASGGAVGSAFFINGLRAGIPAPAPKSMLTAIHDRSVTSSLDAVAYGLVFLDLPRFFTGDLLFAWTGMDRASLLENRWRSVAGTPSIPLHELGAGIRSGLLPAPIFNLTAMETGRRVMATPVVFAGAPTDRAPTLDEYLLAPETAIPDKAAPPLLAEMDLWTAARLSATFPYVTPAARAMIDRRRRPGPAGHHMIDGGYNDNYGVASALEFLAPVMSARLTGELSFKRLLIIQLRATSSRSAPRPPAAAITATLVGPLIGVLNVRDGATLPRNEAAIDQFIARWNGAAGIQVTTVVFEPRPTGPDDEEPLSWHLTERQKVALRQRWAQQPDLAGNLCRVRQFLDPTASCP
jgi:hypothetical protein